jgi:glycosyltransferase involved in cell wall biosynthesis
MILVVEPIFPNAQHAPGNGGKLRAIRIAAAGEPVAFAAHPAHRAVVFDILGHSDEDAYTHIPLPDIPAAGGIRFDRFRFQAGVLIRWSVRLDARTVVCLGTTPETLFACRLLAALRPSTRIVAVLHGNLHRASERRTRDPRHRLFDHAGSLRAARHRSIQLVVLEEAIRRDAVSQGLIQAERSVAWPHPVNLSEIHRPGPRAPGPLRIGFLGSAHRDKGFGDFLALARRFAGGPYEFRHVGGVVGDFPAEDLALVGARPGFLDRAEYLRRLRELDYVCLPLDPSVYGLTVSGAVLDAVAAEIPLLAYRTPILADMAGEGPMGVLCDGLEAMAAALADPAVLADPAWIERCRATLRSHRERRSPEALAEIVRPSLA